MVLYLNVSRRTAERQHDSVMDLFPALECLRDDGRIKRWRMPGSALVGISEPRPDMVASAEVASRDSSARGEADRGTLFRVAAATLHALMGPGALVKPGHDIEALMQAEGIATRHACGPSSDPAFWPTSAARSSACNSLCSATKQAARKTWRHGFYARMAFCIAAAVG